MMASLYAFAALLLLIRLDGRPAYAYNWEPYTAYGLFAFWDRPTFAIFRLTGGLITDSGSSPLVVLPAWLAFTAGGVGLLTLRIGTALVAAGAVPMLWWTGRHFVGARAAALAALLLALSPAYLLYGRTATTVGLSLVPALATVEALRRVLHRPADRRWLLALQAGLIVGSFAYAPVRFLWPVAVLALGAAAMRRPAGWPTLRRAFLATLFMPWLAITCASLHDPATALVLYFDGRGEHIFGLTIDPKYYGYYLRPDPAVADPGPPQGNALTLGARLIAQNAGDLANLLLDRHTRPAITDFWNVHGRLYPGFLAPFLALGLLLAAAGARRRLEDRLLLGLAATWTLPLLLTSKVHIPRLIFFFPLLCLLVANGATQPANWLAKRATAQFGAEFARRASLATAALIAALLLATVSAATWRDFRASPSSPPQADYAVTLRAAAESDPSPIALILRGDQGEDPTEGIGEATEVAALRLLLDPYYDFVSLHPDAPAREHPVDPNRPALYYGAILARLAAADGKQLPCNVTFYVARDALSSFHERYPERRAACGDARVVVLP
jgi:4-amino-4-deoxy-L-arabinose transferase-like glycosyltransferase